MPTVSHHPSIVHIHDITHLKVKIRLYFHHITNSTSNLPSTTQSTLTAGALADLATINRSMDEEIGTTGQVGLSVNTTGTSLDNYYFTRFVSPPIYQETNNIPAGSWTYNFAASQSNVRANFPVTSNNKPVYVNCYVWRPSTGTKIGTILDGNTASEVDESAGADVEESHHVVFQGTTVSSLLFGDVIIFEAWFRVDPDQNLGGGGASLTFFYDGNTITTLDNVTVSNHASYIETAGPINLTPIEPLYERSVLDTLQVAANVVATRRVSVSVAESLSIVDDSPPPTTMKRANRIIGTQSFMINGVFNRLGTLTRTLSETLEVSDSSVTGIRIVPRILNETTTTISDIVDLGGMAIRSVSNSLTVSSDQVTSHFRSIRSIGDNHSISDISLHVRRVVKPISELLTISSVVERLRQVPRSANNSLDMSANVSGIRRVLVTTILESLTSITDNTSKMLRGNRFVNDSFSVVDTIPFAEIIERFARSVNESLTIEATGTRIRIIPRMLTESITMLSELFTKHCRAEETEEEE